MNFTFTELSEETEVDESGEEREYTFERFVGESDTITVLANNPIEAWGEMTKNIENPIPWKCVETGFLSIDYAKMGHDPVEMVESNE